MDVICPEMLGEEPKDRNDISQDSIAFVIDSEPLICPLITE